MNLSDLKKSISEMTDEELQGEILRLRSARRMPVAPVKTTMTGGTKKKKAKMSRADISDLLRSLSGEELADLVGRMEEEA